MTTLILLCLALIGAGMFLFAPQVRAQIVGGLSLKFLCFALIGVSTLLPVSQARAELVYVCAFTGALSGVSIHSTVEELRLAKPNDDEGLIQIWMPIVEDYLDKGFQLLSTDTSLSKRVNDRCLLLYKKTAE